jgi:hypothetical protein
MGPRANLDAVENGNHPLLGFLHYGEFNYLLGIKLLYKCHDIQRLSPDTFLTSVAVFISSSRLPISLLPACV